MPKTAHNRFLVAVKRLSQLYDFSMHCYLEVKSTLEDRVESGDLKASSHIPSNHGFVVHHRVANTLLHAKPDGFFPRQLRSTILVRLITELEVFLIEQIRESSIKSGLTFNSEGRFEWERRHLFSYDNLDQIKTEFRDKDCRSLSSGGFDEIRKYYLKHLEIDICPSGMPLKTIREIHARRHLHVHRAGLIDQTYKKEFNSPHYAGFVLHVTDTYLKAAINTAKAIAKHVSGESNKRYERTDPVKISSTNPTMPARHVYYALTGKFDSIESLEDYFKLDRRLFDNSGPEFRTIFAGAEHVHAKCEWSILGDASSLTYFFKDLRDFQSSGRLALIKKKRLTPKTNGA